MPDPAILAAVHLVLGARTDWSTGFAHSSVSAVGCSAQHAQLEWCGHQSYTDQSGTSEGGRAVILDSVHLPNGLIGIGRLSEADESISSASLGIEILNNHLGKAESAYNTHSATLARMQRRVPPPPRFHQSERIHHAASHRWYAMPGH